MSLRIGSCFAFLSCVTLGMGAAVGGERTEVGRELFSHEWRQNDPHSAAGDGLGPMFNDVSCVACHKQGGIGGGGPVEKNVQVGSVFGNSLNIIGAAGAQQAELEKLHPGFLKTRSVVLHRSSTDEAYGDFRQKKLTHRPEVDTAPILDLLLIGKANPFAGLVAAAKLQREVADEALTDQLAEDQRQEIARLKKVAPARLGRRNLVSVSLLISERNTPALFGSGLIDSIPDRELKLVAQMKHDAWPEVTGRVARSNSGKVGRFGWKGQQAKLHDFVLAACATEVGLQVPGKSQGLSPLKSDYQAPGLDLTADQCLELTSFIAKLPAPRELAAADAASFTRLSEGSNLFGAIGCAVCHRRDLGEVSGIYSDLLLHDMGHGLSDPGEPGAYGGSEDDDQVRLPLPPLAGDFGIPNVEAHLAERVNLGDRPVDGRAGGAAGPQEWRTPPLWGVRDSAPYLHDGRAETIEEAIAAHDGEAQRSARQFFQLSAEQRAQLLAFLNSLAAPE